jgi:hypothetical protein
MPVDWSVIFVVDRCNSLAEEEIHKIGSVIVNDYSCHVSI